MPLLGIDENIQTSRESKGDKSKSSHMQFMRNIIREKRERVPAPSAGWAMPTPHSRAQYSDPVFLSVTRAGSEVGRQPRRVHPRLIAWIRRLRTVKRRRRSEVPTPREGAPVSSAACARVPPLTRGRSFRSRHRKWRSLPRRRRRGIQVQVDVRTIERMARRRRAPCIQARLKRGELH